MKLKGKKEFRGEPKATHHIYRHGDSRRTNRPDGLLLLHKKCHIDLHEKHREREFQKPVKKYEPSTFMSIIHKRFYRDIPSLDVFLNLHSSPASSGNFFFDSWSTAS